MSPPLPLVTLAALGAVIPALYVDQPAATAKALRAAGFDSVRVPPAREPEWRESGVAAVALTDAERKARIAAKPPRIVGGADVASATRRPWIDANGWRYVRDPQKRFFLQAPKGAAVLAAAEAFAHGADLVLAADAADLEPLGRALAAMRTLPEAPAGAPADVAVVDDGSFAAGELMNLLARRNLLFRPVARAVQDLPSVELGTREYPRAKAGDPDALALKVRERIGDERLLRVYGSEVVLARLTGDESRLRVHLLNYGGRDIEGLRVRLRGAWKPEAATVIPHGRGVIEDSVGEDGATEFSLGVIGVYAAVDLVTAR